LKALISVATPAWTQAWKLLQELFHLRLTLNCCTYESTERISKPDEGIDLVSSDTANFARPNAKRRSRAPMVLLLETVVM